MSSIAPDGVQIAPSQRWKDVAHRVLAAVGASVEDRLAAQAQQFVLWMPVALGIGIASWFLLPSTGGWLSALSLFAMLMLAGLAIGGRAGRLIGLWGLLSALGLILIWVRAEWVAAPVLRAPVTIMMSGEVERVEHLTGRGLVRVTLLETGGQGMRARVSFRRDDATGIDAGAHIAFRARLMPPASAAIPGGYSFARAAWFKGIGATGRALGKPVSIGPADRGGFWAAVDRTRGWLTRHVQGRIGGAEGGIAASLVTGDQGGVTEDVAQAMRDSGLTHLLSISGLHITAVVAFFMIATRRLLALSTYAATHWPLTLIGAGAGALAGVGYSILAGGEVPTVRSCIAALLVLLGLAIGREAITLRVVAAGAFLILLIRPEALMGASFQLSFAAVTAIVALHELPWMRRHLARREEPWWSAALRMFGGLLLTGIVVEAALTPIGLFHFNRMGMYGALANIVAIPWTTFVIMPLEALALLLDPIGLGGPFYLLTQWSLRCLTWLATTVAGMPGGVALSPAIPAGAFGLMVGGGLWLALWCGHIRLWGIVPFVIGAAWGMLTPSPDLLITGDGRHIGVRTADGRVVLLRSRTGGYVRSVMSDAAAATDVGLIEQNPLGRCSADACFMDIWRGGVRLRILATRSRHFINRPAFEAACANADVVVSDRALPYWCVPRWLKADRQRLERTGGLAINVARGQVKSVHETNDDHPWSRFSGS